VVEEREAPADTPPPTDPCWQPICRGGLPGREVAPVAQPCAGGGLCFRDGVCRVIRQIATDRRQTCVLLSDGSVTCWGGYIGMAGAISEYNRPAAVRSIEGARLLAAGGGWNFALTARDELRVWAPVNLVSGYRGPTVVHAGGALAGTVALAGSSSMGCALGSGGEVRCWTSQSWDTDSALIVLPGQAIALAGKSSRVCALLASGAVHCWEEEAFAAAKKLHQGTPTLLVGQVPGARSLAISLASYCVRREDSSVWCWGGPRRLPASVGGYLVVHGPDEIIPGGGQQDTRQPRQVPGLGETLSITANDSSFCGLQRGGEVLCWGLPLLSGSRAAGPPRRAPTKLDGFADTASLAIGPEFVCALRQDGAVVCAGNNTRGHLGGGLPSDTAPQLIPF
jgi:hypothetical protein